MVRTQRKYPAMTVTIALGFALLSCRYEKAGLASGLNGAALQKVRPGNTHAEVVRLLGPPLQDLSDPGGGGKRWLVYAHPAAVEGGQSSVMLGGLTCHIVLEKDAVVEADVYDTKADKVCVCNAAACASSWLSDCIPRLPSGPPTK